MSRNVQFITDAEGNRTAVILPMDEYEQLMEDLHLARIYEESRDEDRIPWDQIKKELIAEGKRVPSSVCRPEKVRRPERRPKRRAWRLDSRRDQSSTIAKRALWELRSKPKDGGSQFFITHSPQPHLDGVTSC